MPAADLASSARSPPAWRSGPSVLGVVTAGPQLTMLSGVGALRVLAIAGLETNVQAMRAVGRPGTPRRNRGRDPAVRGRGTASSLRALGLRSAGRRFSGRDPDRDQRRHQRGDPATLKLSARGGLGRPSRRRGHRRRPRPDGPCARGRRYFGSAVAPAAVLPMPRRSGSPRGLLTCGVTSAVAASYWSSSSCRRPGRRCWGSSSWSPGLLRAGSAVWPGSPVPIFLQASPSPARRWPDCSSRTDWSAAGGVLVGSRLLRHRSAWRRISVTVPAVMPFAIALLVVALSSASSSEAGSPRGSAVWTRAT